MSDQSDKWHATRKSRMNELFSGKHYEIMSEETLDEPLKTPLGYKAKKGYWLRTEEADGSSTKIWVGKTLLNQIADEYNAVDRPEPKRRGRPRKPATIEQAEEFANRDIPADAQEISQPGPTYPNPNADESL